MLSQSGRTITPVASSVLRLRSNVHTSVTHNLTSTTMNSKSPSNPKFLLCWWSVDALRWRICWLSAVLPGTHQCFTPLKYSNNTPDRQATPHFISNSSPHPERYVPVHQRACIARSAPPEWFSQARRPRVHNASVRPPLSSSAGSAGTIVTS